jgi:hypothetical protein
MFEKMVLRDVRGPKRDEVQGNGQDYLTRSFMVYTLN